MFYVYVLKSTSRNYYYTGSTNDLKKRFQQHQDSLSKSTKPYAPFILIYYEACLDKKDAYIREKYLKSRLGKSFLKKRLPNWFKNAKV